MNKKIKWEEREFKKLNAKDINGDKIEVEYTQDNLKDDLAPNCPYCKQNNTQWKFNKRDDFHYDKYNNIDDDIDMAEDGDMLANCRCLDCGTTWDIMLIINASIGEPTDEYGEKILKGNKLGKLYSPDLLEHYCGICNSKNIEVNYWCSDVWVVFKFANCNDCKSNWIIDLIYNYIITNLKIGKFVFQE